MKPTALYQVRIDVEDIPFFNRCHTYAGMLMHDDQKENKYPMKINKGTELKFIFQIFDKWFKQKQVKELIDPEPTIPTT